jgi:hypothetical protein
LYDYQETGQGDITLYSGDIIVITKKDPSGWWTGKNERSGQTGQFPENYIEMIEDGPGTEYTYSNS